ncbi:MAG: NIL domain-containing protein [Kovacikia sp.]
MSTRQMVGDDGEYGVVGRTASTPQFSGHSSLNQIRLRVQIPARYRQEPIISRLISKHGLVVNILGAMLRGNSEEQGWLDLELRGTAQQIRSGLIYLESFQLKLVGKPNSDGDSWYY